MVETLKTNPKAPFISKNNCALNLHLVTIESERVVLKPASQKYAADMFREFTPDITRYMFPRSPTAISETEQFIADSSTQMINGTDLVMVILSKEPAGFLGVCGLHAGSTPKQPELGIWLAAAAHGNAYGREAISSLRSWAIRNLEVDSFVYPVDRANIASRKIPEALGGEVIDERITPTIAGGTLDTLVYRIPA